MSLWYARVMKNADILRRYSFILKLNPLLFLGFSVLYYVLLGMNVPSKALQVSSDALLIFCVAGCVSSAIGSLIMHHCSVRKPGRGLITLAVGGAVVQVLRLLLDLPQLAFLFSSTSYLWSGTSFEERWAGGFGLFCAVLGVSMYVYSFVYGQYAYLMRGVNFERKIEEQLANPEYAELFAKFEEMADREALKKYFSWAVGENKKLHPALTRLYNRRYREIE